MSNQHATYKVFFGFQKEPFGQNVRVEDMMKSNALIGVKERFLYAVGLCAALVITGDVGSGKSSGLRFASSLLHPSEYKVWSPQPPVRSSNSTSRYAMPWTYR
jgi:type II secretory pathway predicted ATPase ExeA